MKSKIVRWLRDKKVELLSFIYKKRNKTSSFSRKSILFSSKALLFNSSVGEYSYFAGEAAVGNAIIGKYCSIADGVKIGMGVHPVNKLSTHPRLYSENTIFPYRLLTDFSISETKKTEIGNDVWIGADAKIMDGVTISTGAIIGAGAVVTRDVAAYAVVGGVPAKVLKYRFSDEIISELLDSNWWNLSEKELIEFEKNCTLEKI